jgi:hypothetical protein
MALIKCKECGQQMSSSAKACPHCGKQRPSATKTGCAWIIVLFGATIIWGIWKGSSEPSSTPPPPSALAVTSQPSEPSPQQKPPQPRESWGYLSSPDSMTGKSIRSAWAKSQNTVDFSFPYTGVQHAMLTLRKHPRFGTDAIFSIERGQFGCGIDGCSILVRFDDGSAERYTGNEPDDHGTTEVFISPAARFITHLRKAKVVRVESSFYQEGHQVFTFDVTGLDEKKFGG